MSLRLARSLAILCIIAAPAVAHAEIIFGDIGYDVPGADEGREWVIIHNTGSDPVNLTGWKFFEGGINHKLVPISSTLVPAGGGAVIVSSLEGYHTDHPGYEGLIFTSSFSLKNTGETLSLKNASGTIMATITYVPKKTSNQKPTVPHIGTSSQATREAASEGGIIPWIGGVAAVIVLGIGAAFMMRLPPTGEADEYSITEDQS